MYNVELSDILQTIILFLILVEQNQLNFFRKYQVYPILKCLVGPKCKINATDKLVLAVYVICIIVRSQSNVA